jgi:hypothetical protein
MSAQVIPMESVSRSSLPSSDEQANLQGFIRALLMVKGLEQSTPVEKRIAIENWFNAGAISEGERNALCNFYGWRDR